jgi:predicted Zn-dependent peptidase
MVTSEESVVRIVLSNGLIVLIEPVPYLKTISTGVWIGTGSGNEIYYNNGISHFIEHLLFKGRESFELNQLIGNFEKAGGKLNAFTEREFTSFNARSLGCYLSRTIRVLGKIVCNRHFSTDEIEQERKIVLTEIIKKADFVADSILEKIINLYWGEAAFGLPIVGTEDSVSKIDEVIFQ